MIELILLALPAALGLAVPRLLLRRRPDAPRWQLLVGAPVLALLVSYVLLVVVWLGLQFFAGALGRAGVDVMALADIVVTATAGMILAPLCAFGAAVLLTWKRRATKGGARG